MDELLCAILDGIWDIVKRRRDEQRCPACKKHRTREVERREYVLSEEAFDNRPPEQLGESILDYYWLHYRCRSCGQRWATLIQDRRG